MRREGRMLRVVWTWIMIGIGLNPLSVFAQMHSLSFDLGVVNGELKSFQRQVYLPQQVMGEELRLSNEAMEVTSYAYDSLLEKTGVILRVNVKDRLGSFTDTLYVLSGDGFIKEDYLLTYQVLSPVGDVFKSYRNEFWPFKSQNQVFNLQIAYAGDTLAQSFDLLNFSGKSLDLSSIRASDSLDVSFEPRHVEHNSFTRMSLRMVSKDSSSLGFSRRKVLLLSKEDTLAFIPIQYSLLPAPLAEGPMLNMTRSELDYKVVKKGDLITEVVLVSNEGSELLEIFKVETNCDCLKASLSNRFIAPQQNAQLRLRFDTTDRGGLERKTITLFTNDPTQPVKTIVIKAHVK